MKKKIISLLIIVLIIVITNVISVFAGWADFTDEQADKKAQEQMKEQEEHKVTEVKSSDNYLTSLQLEGYTLTPEFDKQILEYTIKENFNAKELNIKTITSNDKAIVSGDGIVKVVDGKDEYRIDVTAENGTVRTYVIKLKNTEDKRQEQDDLLDVETTGVISEIDNKDGKQEVNSEKKISNTTLYIIIGIAVLILIVLLCLSKKKSKKRRKRKH